MRGLPGALVNRAKSLRPSGKKIPITPRGKDDFHEDSAPGARAADGSRAYTLCRSGVEVERRSVTAPAGGRAHPKLKMTPEMAALTQIQELFRVGPDGGGSPLRLAWSVVRRRGKPLLLLPQNFHSATVALQLYAAQRPAAKAIRKLLPWYAGTPLRALGQQLIIHSNTAMPWPTFLRRQWGGAASRLPTPAILVGNQAADAQRFILLVLDETKSPVAVVKAGLRPPARHIIEREAEVLRQLPASLPGIPAFRERFSGEVGSAFAMDFYAGHSPAQDDQIGAILGGWLHADDVLVLGDSAAWRELARVCSAEARFRSLITALAGRQVRAAVQHGDFAPWNVKVRPDGGWVVVDWERGELRGIPGWDWLHYEIQTSILRRRLGAEAVAVRLQALFQQPSFQRYVQTANIAACLRPLTLAYLLYHNRVIRPGEGLRTGEELLQLLAARWA